MGAQSLAVPFAMLMLLGIADARAADGFGTGAPLAADVKAIHACLGTDKDPGERRSCIGIVSRPCLNSPEGRSTIGMEQCQSRELVVWQQVLSRAYEDALKDFDEPGKAYLREVQTLWTKFRDQSCRWSSKVYPGGTIAGPLTGGCILDETANRAITLTEISESLQTH